MGRRTEQTFSNDQMGFPDSSVGKEFAHNAGDPSSIRELGRAPGEGKGTHSSFVGLPWWISS